MNKIAAVVAVAVVQSGAAAMAAPPGISAARQGVAGPSGDRTAAGTLHEYAPPCLLVLGAILILGSRLLARRAPKRRARPSRAPARVALLTPPLTATPPAAPPPVTASPASPRPAVVPSSSPARDPVPPAAVTEPIPPGPPSDATVVDSYAAVRSMLISPADDKAADDGGAAAAPAPAPNSDATVIDSYASMRARLQIS